MKKVSFALLFGALIVAFMACSKSPEDLRPPTTPPDPVQPTDTADTQAPTTPANLVGTATVTTISLSWSASTDNKGVAGYTLYRGDNAIKSLTGLAYVDSGLVPQTVYVYRVEAYDAKGNRSAKSAAVAITTEPAPPQTFAPTITTGEYSSSAKTSIVFRGNITADGGAAITVRFFVITWTNPLTGAAQKDSAVVSGVVFEYEKSDILPGLTYHCRAGALNSAGSGYGQPIDAATAGFHPGQDLGYGMVIHPYANYDSAIVVSKQEDINPSIGHIWGSLDVFISGTSSGLFAGRSNTDAIIAQDPDQNSAARVVRASTTGGKVWSLPSPAELQKINDYFNAVAVAGSFQGGSIYHEGQTIHNSEYWTSTQGSATILAYCISMNGNGIPATDIKNATYGIRKVTYIGL